jgi:hypothetical protein
MNFFFVQDHRRRHSFFSSEPFQPGDVKPSKARAVWETAKKKVTGLSPRMLLQEAAFAKAGAETPGTVTIHYPDGLDEKKAKLRFFFFLQRQRTRHIFVLAGEALLVPVSGLAAILPGPNVFFYFLAVLMIIQWEAARGLSRLGRKKHEYVPSPLLAEWEAAVEAGDESRYDEILGSIERSYGLADVRKILWK